MKNESEGMLIKISNEAEARKRKICLEAEGEAAAILVTAQAQAEAIRAISKALSESGNAGEAAKYNLAKQYIAMYADIGSKSNTMIFNDRPADVNALLAQASTIVKAAPLTSLNVPDLTNKN